MEQREFFTVPAFAKIVGLATEVCYRHIRQGTLQASRIGRTYRIPKVVLDRMAQGGNAADTAEKAEQD